MPKKNNDPLVTAVCIGRRVNRKGVYVHAYRFIEEDGTLGSERLWSSALGCKGKRGADVVGGRYEFRFAGSTASDLPAKYTGRWDDEDARDEWYARDTAAVARVAAERDRKKAKAHNPLHERLDPLRVAYEHAGWQGREKILAEFIRYITSA